LPWLTTADPPHLGTRREALRYAQSAALKEAKFRFLQASSADRVGGQHATGVRWWILYHAYGSGLGISPIPDCRRSDFDYRLFWEERLEDYALWLVVFKPSGKFISGNSLLKYCSSVRAWLLRFHRVTLGLGAAGGRIRDIAKGFATLVDQPPPLERIGCTPADLVTGMAGVLDDGLEGDMWRAALSFGMSAMARAVEFAVDAGRAEVFDPTQHMIASDVSEVLRDGATHCAVRMRKRKNLRVLRGKDQRVLIAAGGSYFDSAGLLRTWLRRRRAAGIAEARPLFCHATGAPITTAEVRAMVKAVMAAAGRDPAIFGGHSLRIGGATAALAAGVAPNLIRLMGRWQSDVYELYCRMSVEAALGVGVAIASSSVAPLSEIGFHEEHLELQPEELELRRGEADEAAADDEDGDETVTAGRRD
jgi:hypothetical protein